jgi:hypothetical protein
MNTVTIKDLKLDHDLTIRSEVSEKHVESLVEAIRAGCTLPPIVYERKTMRIVDGLHRVAAYTQLKREEIPAMPAAFEDDKEFFTISLSLNAKASKGLDAQEQLDAYEKATALGITDKEFCEAINVSEAYLDLKKMVRLGTAKKVKTVQLNRDEEDEEETKPTVKPRKGTYAMSNGSYITLRGACKHMAGKELSPAQVAAQDRLGGMSQAYYLQQVVLLLSSNLIDLEDKEVVKSLLQIKALINNDTRIA